MKIALYTGSLSCLPLEEAIPAAAEAGYRAVDLMCEEPHFDRAMAQTDSVEVAGLVARSGMSAPVLSLPASLTRPDGWERELERIEIYMGLADAFGARLLALTAGGPGSAEATEEEWRRAGGALGQLAAMAGGYGVRLAFLAKARQLLDNIGAAQRFLSMTPSDVIGVAVDFGGLALAGHGAREVMAALGRRVWLVRAEMGGGGSGAPALDCGEMARALREWGYRDIVSVASWGGGAEQQVAAARQAREQIEAAMEA